MAMAALVGVLVLLVLEGTEADEEGAGEEVLPVVVVRHHADGGVVVGFGLDSASVACMKIGVQMLRKE